MSNRVICPHCSEKLILRGLTSDNTRIKCGKCKGSFRPNEAATASPSSSENKPLGANDSPPLVSPQPRRSSKPDSDTFPSAPPQPFPQWLAVAGLSGIAVLSLSGLMLGQKPPPISEPPMAVVHSSGLVSSSAKSPIESAQFTKPRAELPRPATLIGCWDLQEPNGGVIEFGDKGEVRVDAPLLNGKILSFTSKWFVVDRDGDAWEIEFGSEAFGLSNHRLRVAVTGESGLKLVKYSNPAGLDVRERTFVKRK